MASEYAPRSTGGVPTQPFLEALPKREQYVAADFLRQFLGREELPGELDRFTPGRKPYTEMLLLLQGASDEYHASGVTSERQFRDPTLPRVSVAVFDNGVVHMIAETQQGEPLSHTLFDFDEGTGDMINPLIIPAERNTNDVLKEAEERGLTLVHHVLYEPVTYTPEASI